MGRVLFYHLTRSAVEDTLLLLLQKSLDAGLRVDLRGPDPDWLAWLDEKLWLGPEDGFLPHALAGGPHDALQPVLLTTAAEVRAGVTCLIGVGGAEVSAEEAAALDRVCILFDGRDAAATERARDQWRRLTAAGAIAEYWSQDSGSWECLRKGGG